MPMLPSSNDYSSHYSYSNNNMSTSIANNSQASQPHNIHKISAGNIPLLDLSDDPHNSKGKKYKNKNTTKRSK
jgi:hypothetical protein